jgi:hypothetical protein
VNNKSSISADRSHEKAQLENDIVSWGWVGYAPAFHQVIRGKNQGGEIKLVNNAHKRFESAFAKAKGSLSPKCHFAVVLEINLDSARDRQPFPGRADKQGGASTRHPFLRQSGARHTKAAVHYGTLA